MGYLVLARKYRPQNFKEVIGQEHVTRTLMSALESKKIGHSYIFAGPRGVGKTSVARIMAKSLNCKEGIRVNPCNECELCREITRGNATDVIEIDGASNRGIDEIRNLRESASYTPVKSRFKIYIIDEVHMLTKEAFNALLKTLEEPPSHVIFIFATTEPRKVPKTVLSRCQRFDFRKLRENEIYEKLKLLVEKESVEAEDNALVMIAARAEGSIRDAEGMLDQMISYSEGKIKEKDVREVFGFIGDEVYADLFNFVMEKKENEIIKKIEEIFEQGHDLQEFSYGWIEFLRKLMLFKVKATDLDYKENEIFKSVANKVSTNLITAILNLSTDMERTLMRIPYTKAYIELNFIKMSRVPDVEDISNIINNLKAGSLNDNKSKIRGSTFEKEDFKAEEPKNMNLDNFWGRVISRIDGLTGNNFFKSFVRGIEPISMNDNNLKVKVPRSHRDHIERDLELLKEACREVAGKTVEVEIESKDEPFTKQKEDPMIKKVKEIFDAEEYF